MSAKRILESLRVNENNVKLHKSIVPGKDKLKLKDILDKEGFTYKWVDDQFVIEVDSNKQFNYLSQLADKYDVRHNKKGVKAR